MSEVINISGLSERDIDLLLAEELFVSSALRAHLLTAASLPPEAPASFVRVRRGVTHSSGESDLELDVTLQDGRRGRLLIENKVDAALQHRQPERYTERAAAYTGAHACDVARTLIVAPERYFGDGDSGFDAAVSYEELIVVLQEAGLEPSRLRYRVGILSSAIEKAQLGYQRQADSDMTSLWRQYGAIVAELAPELNMPQEEGRPTGSHFVYFRPDDFPRPLQLIHKFAYGHVDIQLPGWGASLGALRAHLGDILPPGAVIVRAEKSAAVRIPVERVIVSSSSEERDRTIRLGVATARMLNDWVRSNRTVLEKFRNAPA